MTKENHYDNETMTTANVYKHTHTLTQRDTSKKKKKTKTLGTNPL